MSYRILQAAVFPIYKIEMEHLEFFKTDLLDSVKLVMLPFTIINLAS